MAALLDKLALPNSNHSKYTSLNAADGIKGYCIPNYTIEESKKIQLVDNQSACPSDFTAFVTVHCIDISISGNVSGADDQLNKLENRHCLNAKDVVKLNKCGDGWLTSSTDGRSCLCSKVDIWMCTNLNKVFKLNKSFQASEFLTNFLVLPLVSWNTMELFISLDK